MFRGFMIGLSSFCSDLVFKWPIATLVEVLSMHTVHTHAATYCYYQDYIKIHVDILQLSSTAAQTGVGVLSPKPRSHGNEAILR